MTWKELKDKVDESIQKKGLEDHRVDIEFVYVTIGMIHTKTRIVIRKKRSVKGKSTHDLFVDWIIVEKELD